MTGPVLTAVDSGPAAREAAVARLHGPGQVRLVREPAPKPAPGEVLVRVTAVGLCGSDLHWYLDGTIGDTALAEPLVLGHEFGGVIASGPRAGRRVVADPSIPCLACEPCREGNEHLCLAVRFAGYAGTDGALRELTTWPERCLHEVPDTIADPEVALLEPLGVALHAADLAHLRAGATVAILGAGPIGLLLVQLARLQGASRVLATDVLPHRLAAAAARGAEPFEASPAGDEREPILRATGGRGVDVIVEAAGTAAAVETAVAVARPGGRIVLVGIPADDRIAFRASTARRKGLVIALSRRMRAGYERPIALVERGEVELAGLVTDRYALDEVEAAFRRLASRNGIKVVVEPDAGRGGA